MSGLISAGEKAYARLLRQIVSGKLPAGSKLPEEALCAELGVSRTPLREALQQLEKDGLVERRPRYGCTVRRFDPQEVAEIFECRAILEAKALELGFDSIAPGRLRELEEALQLSGDSVPPAGSAIPPPEMSEEERAESLRADRVLHALVAESCPNRALRQMVQEVQKRTSPFRDDRSYRPDTAGMVHCERLRILSAIQQGDRTAACALLEQHIRAGAGLLHSAK